MNKFNFKPSIFSSILFISFILNTPISYLLISHKPAQAKLPDNFEYYKYCNNDRIGERFSYLQEAERKTFEKQQFEDTIIYLKAALNVAEENAKYSEVLRFWLEEDSNITELRFQTLIKYAQRTKQTPKILSLLEQFTQIANRINSGSSFSKTNFLAEIASIYTQVAQKEQALTALNQAVQAEKLIKGAAFHAKALPKIALGYIAIGQKSMALTLLASAEKNLLQIPQNTSFQKEYPLFLITKAYAQLGNDKVNKIISNNIGNAQLNAIHGALEVYLDENKLDLAEQSIQQLKIPASIPSQVLLLNKLAAGYGKNKRQDKAKEIFKKALQNIQSPTTPLTDREYLTIDLISKHLQAGLRDEALQIARTQLKVDNYQKAQALKDIAIAYSDAKQTEPIAQILTENFAITQSLTDGIGKEFAVKDLWTIAIKANQFIWIAEQWQNIQKLLPDSDKSLLLEEAASGYAKTGNYEQAVKWIGQFTPQLNPNLRASMLSAIAFVAGRNQRTELANNLLQQAVALIPTPSKNNELSNVNSETRAKIALKYAQIGQIEKMRQLLNQVLPIASAGQPSSYPLDSYRIFNMFLDNQVYSGAIQIASTTKDSAYRQQRFQEIARKYIESNRIDSALPIIQKVSDTSVTIDLLKLVAQRYEYLGKPATAFPKAYFPLVDRVTSDVKKQKKEPNEKTFNLLSLVNIYRHLGNSTQALSLLDAAFPIAQTIPGGEYILMRFGNDGTTIIRDTRDRGSMYEYIATQYAELGQAQKAINVVSKLQNKQYREVVIQDINCILNQNK